jgi:hypothetical protein
MTDGDIYNHFLLVFEDTTFVTSSNGRSSIYQVRQMRPNNHHVIVFLIPLGSCAVPLERSSMLQPPPVWPVARSHPASDIVSYSPTEHGGFEVSLDRYQQARI